MSYLAENNNNLNLEADRKFKKSFLSIAVHRIKKILSRVKPRKVVKPHLPTAEEIQNDINEALEAKAKAAAASLPIHYVFIAPDMDLREVRYLSFHQSPQQQCY